MQQGTLAEIHVANYFAKLGYNIYISLGGNGPIDLIIEKDHKTKRVQVKSTSQLRKGKWTVKLSKNRSNRTRNRWIPFSNRSCDILAIYIVPEDRVVLLNPKTVNQKSQLQISSKET